MYNFNEAYKESTIGDSIVPYGSWNTVPVAISIDSYNLPLVAGNVIPGKYTTMLPCIYREVVSIELVHAIIPIPNANSPYVSLKINGLSRVESNNNNTRGSFCVLYQDNQGDTHFRFKRVGSTPDDKYIYYFPEPVKLNKFDIEILTPDGAICNGANDTNHHVLTFEVKCLNRAVKE